MRAISTEKREIYEFGGFRFDLDERTIERVDGLAAEALPEKTLQILALLVSRPGHLVTKDEILHQIWPDSFVEGNNVDKRVHQLRQFLGKTESGGKFIETVRSQGYRFVGRVNVVKVSGTWLPETFRLPDEDKHSEKGNGDHAKTNGSGPDVEHTNNEQKRARRFRYPSTVVIAYCAALVIVSAVAVGYFGFIRSGSARTPRSIAILPAAAINAAERSDLYEAGIADALINRLSASDGLKIRPLGSVRDYAGQKVDPIAAGREQEVDYVLESNYQIADGKIKVTGRLYNVASGKVEDSFQNQQEVANVFGAQDAIAADFSNRLMTRFNSSATRSAKTRGTSNEEAYRLYQQGMFLVDKRGPTNTGKGLDYLEQALTLDPNYADAWAAKAIALRTGSFGLLDQTELHRASMEAVNRALAIDPDLSETYSALCGNKFLFDYDFAAAEAACKRAVELDPNSSIAHRTTATLLSGQGRHDEAIAEYKIAMDLEPDSYLNKQVFSTGLYLARRYDEAAAQFQRLIDLDPSSYVPYNGMIRTLEAQGKEAEAFEWFKKLLIARNKDASRIQLYTDAYHDSGWRGVLVERAKDPDESMGNRGNFFIACLYARAGEKDMAFEYLERSFQKREAALPQLKIHPQLDPLRDDPGYVDLVHRVFNQ